VNGTFFECRLLKDISTTLIQIRFLRKCKTIMTRPKLKVRTDALAPVREGGYKPARLISQMEVCDRAGKTYPTIWQWIRDGRFPAGREVGGRTMWLESEVDDWMNGLPVRKLKD
jgi:predicted DNA-binding transcriptional regulator AlpA